MTISLTFSGDSETVKAEMANLLSGAAFTTTVTSPSGETAQVKVEKTKPASGRTRDKTVTDVAVAALATQQGISTGEERVETADDKQDAKDEAAEKPAAPVKLTHDSIRAMLGGYVQAYGMAAAQEDGVKLIGTAKISDLKDDQAVFAKAVIEIATGIEKNPHKRDIAGDGITAEKLAELKPIVAAAIAVK